jgi:phosphonate transport system ATP-binding protein
MSQSLLRLRRLEKIYPNGLRALKNIDLEVKSGEFVVIIGLSGSGKSTLLRCVNRLIEPTSGEIYFHDRRIDQMGRRELRAARRRIGMVFQNFNLVPRHSVLSNVLMGRLGATPTWKSLIGWHSQDDLDEAYHVLRLVGIADKAQDRADQLSGGQQQRTAIARALCQSPELLLADEPVASLDPATSHTVMDCLRRANRELGITILCSLHFLSLVREYASRVVALRAGELVYQGSPADIDEAWFKRIYGEEARDVRIK